MSWQVASPSIVLRLLEGHADGLPPTELIDRMVEDGYKVDEAASVIRSMLQRGELAFGREMNIQLVKQPA